MRDVDCLSVLNSVAAKTNFNCVGVVGPDGLATYVCSTWDVVKKMVDTVRENFPYVELSKESFYTDPSGRCTLCEKLQHREL
jgi:hypothetical protein